MRTGNEEYIPALGVRALTPFYDLVQRWLVGDTHFKSRLIEQADIQAGQRVVDLGCGTGTLAIMVKQAAPGADVAGLDADPQMLGMARSKAARANVTVAFDQGMTYDLPYPDASVDRVLSSLMIHHLKTPDKERTAREVYRVLKPGGQLHVIDFGKPKTFYGKLLGPLLHRFEEANDNIDGRLPEIFWQAGLRVREMGDFMTFFGSLTFLYGEKGSPEISVADTRI
ncbi:MAG TPA: methyltransferase domain-containing protein [Anaerolineales bacterium]|nr:methyltransferase domain-containing protein [Anaerolineales bacterium]